LNTRNELFAHGCRPVSEADYVSHGGYVEDFIANAISAAISVLKLPRRATLQQFPTKMDLSHA